MNDNVLVLYSSGLSGTFIAWFINQHNDFPKFDYDTLKTNRHVTDMACSGATWCFKEDTQDGALDQVETWEEYVNNTVSQYATRNEYTRVCSKILPDHDLTWPEHTSEIKSDIVSHYSKVIMPYIPADSKLLPFYAKRMIVMWEDKFKMRGKDTSVEKLCVGLTEVANRGDQRPDGRYYQHKPGHMINLDRLLMLDSFEYKHLCDFLDLEPLENWEYIVNGYRQRFICRDWNSIMQIMLGEDKE